MAKNKTVETKNSVSVFLRAVKDEKKRKDCSAIIQLFTAHTGLDAKMWGPLSSVTEPININMRAGAKEMPHCLRFHPGRRPSYYIFLRILKSGMNYWENAASIKPVRDIFIYRSWKTLIPAYWPK